MQGVCDANYQFLNVVARWPGSTHDSTIFNNSRIRAELDNGGHPNCIILGDSAYPVKTYLMTPLQNPATPPERRYNNSQIRSRVLIENTFGIWKRRFPVLAYGCRLKLETTLKVIIATAVLHNIARLNRDPVPPVDEEEFQQLIQNGNVPHIPIQQNVGDGAGFLVRRGLIDTFFQ